MIGTIVNSIAIIIGSLTGVVLKGALKEKYQTIVMQAIGLCVCFIGASKAINNISIANDILFVISLVVGSLIGEFIDIDKMINKFGKYAEEKFSKDKSGSFSKGFVTASILYTVGTMSILGALQSGTKNNHEILFLKSILDGISSVILASTFGIGVVLSALSVFVYQGILTLLATFVAPYVTSELSIELDLIGGILITVIGLNVLSITKIKVSNMLLSLFIPIIYFLINKQ